MGECDWIDSRTSSLEINSNSKLSNINMKHFYAIIISVLHLCSGQSLSPEECKNLGFIKSDLLCSSCDDLARFKVSSSITSACRNCCNDEGRNLDEGTTKYPKAILEVCG